MARVPESCTTSRAPRPEPRDPPSKPISRAPADRCILTEHHAPLAQLAEQRTLNPRVVGSSPTRRTCAKARSSDRAFALALPLHQRGCPRRAPRLAAQRPIGLGHVLVPSPGIGHSRHVEPRRLPRPDRTQVGLGCASALCYAVGYPVALAADQSWGWLLVTLGGVLLMALLVTVVRRIDRRA